MIACGKPAGKSEAISLGFPHVSIAPGSPVNSTACRGGAVVLAGSMTGRITLPLSVPLPCVQGEVEVLGRRSRVAVMGPPQNFRSEEPPLAYAALELREFSRSRLWRSR